MKRGQLIVVLAAVLAVALVGIAGQRGGDRKDGAAATRGAQPANAVRVTVASSPEKSELVSKLADEFNATRPSVSGRPVVVSVSDPNSGDEQVAIAKAAMGGAGGDQPVVWTPASTLWARLLEHDADRDLVPEHNPSIVRTPLVLAMWEPMARALGWPRAQIGFADVFRLAQDPRGWAAHGHPEFGPFKLVHTNPAASTSGLDAVTASYFAATGKKEGLTIADVDKPAVRRQIAGIEQSIVHYGDATPFIADQLRKNGPAYASAVAMEEKTLVEFNEDRDGQPKLVGIYPKEGTFYSDSPFIILKAPWVDDAERAGAQAFQRFIGAHLTPAVAARYGFRAADSASVPLPPVDAAHGADPKQPARVLTMPQPDVLAQIQRAWFANRKAANIALVVDTSASMSQERKLARAKVGLAGFLRELSPRDRVGLIAFSDKVRPLVPVQPFSQDKDELEASVRDLMPDGQTALYAATSRAVADIAALNDPDRINAVVVLSDGMDNASEITLDDLVARLKVHAGPEAEPIRVFTIAYGKDATRSILERIAETSDGKSAIGDTDNIEDVYRSISSFF